MNLPDYSRGYLRIPLAVWANLYCRTPLTRRQLQLVSVVLRESWGWQTPDGKVYGWTRPLAAAQFADATGLRPEHASRELAALAARGVLRRDGRRYQLVPDPGLWTTGAGRMPERQRSLPIRHGEPIVSAALAPGLKKANISNRYVGDGLSTTGEKPPSLDERTTAWLGDRLVEIVAALAGPLTTTEKDTLRSWLDRDGLPAVWAALEPFFRQGKTGAPQRVRALLAGKARR